MNDCGTDHFSLFVIDAWKYIFKAIILIHVAFSYKLEVFPKIFIREISNILLILYFHIFFNIVLGKISRTIFF